MKSKRSAFTLIELLIVIAIILILIAIALPNFLEAQIRARVTKARGEIRSLVIAMESYYLEWKVYPAESEQDALVPNRRPRTEAGLTWLTSPIAYITDIPPDPFPGSSSSLAYGGAIITYELGGVESETIYTALETWALFSRGPDAAVASNDPEDVDSENPHFEVPPDGEVNQFSPTNGSKSGGDIFHYGGDSFYIGVPITGANRTSAKTMSPVPLPVDGQFYLHRMPPGLY